MFGGLYPDGHGKEAPELLADLTLEKIDYDWIKEQKKPNFLKKAIKLIEEDGKKMTMIVNFYVHLFETLSYNFFFF